MRTPSVSQVFSLAYVKHIFGLLTDHFVCADQEVNGRHFRQMSALWIWKTLQFAQISKWYDHEITR